MAIRKASKKKAKVRIGLSSASGFGKTYSALLMAYGLIGDWTKICVIDTENNSADLYETLGEYNVNPLEAPFTPERYIDAIKECEDEGMELIIVDSITHEWSSEGGCLDIHSQLGGQFHHWKPVKERHNKFLRKLLQSKCHIITTVRRKQDYDLQDNDKGKKEPVKVGTKEETMQGFEYKLMINFEILNDNHLAKASKDRTNLFANKHPFVITEETGKIIKEWAEKGIDEFQQAIEEIKDCQKYDDIATIWHRYPQFQQRNDFIETAKQKKNEFNQNTGQPTNQG